MEFNDNNDKLYSIFANEYCEHLLSSNGSSWKKFINSKKLGIRHKSNFKCEGRGTVYKIFDEKKWLLSKIKYGI